MEPLTYCEGDVAAWIEREAIHLRAIDGTDPVELTEVQARKLAQALIQLADRIDGNE